MTMMRLRGRNTRRRVLALSVGLLAGIFILPAWAHGSMPQATVTLHVLRAINNPPDNDVIQAYEASHPNVKIAISEVPFGYLFQKISILATSSNPPDVIEYDGPDTQAYASAGVLLPLDKYVSAAWKNDIVSATLKEHSYQGRLYSPGLEQSAIGLFYNKDMTDKLGIHPPRTLSQAWTWPQAEAAFKKCQQGPANNPTVWGLAPSQFGNGTPGFEYRDLLFLRSEGNPHAPKGSVAWKTFYALSPDGKTVDGYLNTPLDIQGATFYQRQFTVDKITPKSGIPNAFINGEACFDLNTSWLVSNLQKAHVTFHWGVTPIPYFKTPITHTGSATIGVVAKSKYIPQAVDFVLFVTGAKEQLRHAQEDSALPALKSLYAKMPEYNTYPLNIFKEELIQWGYSRPPSPHHLEYNQIVTNTMRNIAYGADPKSQLDSAVSQLDPLLQH